MDALKQEVKRNYEAFCEMTFPEHLSGKYAVLRDKEVVKILDTRYDAGVLANTLFEDGIYSIQQINAPIRYFPGYQYATI